MLAVINRAGTYRFSIQNWISKIEYTRTPLDISISPVKQLAVSQYRGTLSQDIHHELSMFNNVTLSGVIGSGKASIIAQVIHNHHNIPLSSLATSEMSKTPTAILKKKQHMLRHISIADNKTDIKKGIIYVAKGKDRREYIHSMVQNLGDNSYAMQSQCNYYTIEELLSKFYGTELIYESDLISIKKTTFVTDKHKYLVRHKKEMLDVGTFILDQVHEYTVYELLLLHKFLRELANSRVSLFNTLTVGDFYLTRSSLSSILFYKLLSNAATTRSSVHFFLTQSYIVPQPVQRFIGESAMKQQDSSYPITFLNQSSPLIPDPFKLEAVGISGEKVTYWVGRDTCQAWKNIITWIYNSLYLDKTHTPNDIVIIIPTLFNYPNLEHVVYNTILEQGLDPQVFPFVVTQPNEEIDLIIHVKDKILITDLINQKIGFTKTVFFIGYDKSLDLVLSLNDPHNMKRYLYYALSRTKEKLYIFDDQRYGFLATKSIASRNDLDPLDPVNHDYLDVMFLCNHTAVEITENYNDMIEDSSVDLVKYQPISAESFEQWLDTECLISRSEYVLAGLAQITKHQNIYRFIANEDDWKASKEYISTKDYVSYPDIPDGYYSDMMQVFKDNINSLPVENTEFSSVLICERIDNFILLLEETRANNDNFLLEILEIYAHHLKEQCEIYSKTAQNLQPFGKLNYLVTIYSNLRSLKQSFATSSLNDYKFDKLKKVVDQGHSEYFASLSWSAISLALRLRDGNHTAQADVPFSRYEMETDDGDISDTVLQTLLTTSVDFVSDKSIVLTMYRPRATHVDLLKAIYTAHTVTLNDQPTRECYLINLHPKNNIIFKINLDSPAIKDIMLIMLEEFVIKKDASGLSAEVSHFEALQQAVVH